MANCSKCGSQLKPGANFCAVCGTRRLPGAGPLPPIPSPGSVPGAPGQNPPGGTSLVPAPPPPSPAPQALLVTRQHQQTPVQDQMLIGRDPACHLFVDVDDVSRRHATIVSQGQGWAVVDLGSRNGSCVNDQPVLAVTPIYHADVLRFGATAEYALYDPAHRRPAAAGVTGGLAQTAVIAAAQPPTQAVTSTGAPGGPVLYQWPRTPEAEGHVVAVRGPVVVERNDKAGKALLALGLGLINPALAFVPFAMGKNQIMITTVRLKKVDDGRHIAVTFVGDVTSIVEDGDLVAVWGQVDQGTVYAVDVYNYTTNALIHISK